MGRKYGIYKLMCFETEKLFEFAMKEQYFNHKGIIYIRRKCNYWVFQLQEALLSSIKE